MQTEKSTVDLSFPFSHLLDRLRLERKVPIGVEDYVRIHRFLENWDGKSSVEIRTAIASLLARNEKDCQTVADTFDEIYKHPQQLGNKGNSLSLKYSRRKQKAWIFGLLTLSILVLCYLFFWGAQTEEPVPPPPISDKSSKPDPLIPPPVSGETRPRPPKLPEPPIVYYWGAPIALAISLALLVFLPFYRGRIRKCKVQLIRQYWRNKLQEQPGAHDYELRLSGLAPPFSRDLLDDISTILARGAGGVTSRRIDIKKTVKDTVRSSLMSTLTFQERRIAPPLLILQDISMEMHPWSRKIDSFVEGLIRRGVRIEHWYFDGDGERVARSKKGPFRKLDEIYVRYMDSALMVISTGFAVADWKNSVRSWVPSFCRWRLRTWVNPISDESRWKRTFKMVPIRVWPMNHQGLLGAAYDICEFEGDNLNAPSHTQSNTRSVTPVDIRKMQRLVALVPYADVNLAEYLRQTYYPDIPEEVILPLVALGTDPVGRVLRWPREELAQLLSEAREDPTWEGAVRRLLINLYEESEPEKGTVAYLRWRLDCAMQRVYLKDKNNEELKLGLQELQDLATGPLYEEVAEAVDRLGIAKEDKLNRDKLTIAEPVEERERQKLHQLINDTLSGTGINDKLVRSSFPFPGILEIATSLSIASILLVGAWQFEMVRKEKLNHIRDAYNLEWEEKDVLAQIDNPAHGILLMKKPPGREEVPAQAKLYVNDTPLNKIFNLSSSNKMTLFKKDRGHWYQLRSRLPNDRLALSEPLWVAGKFIPKLGSLVVVFKSGMDDTPFSKIPFSLIKGQERIDGRSDEQLELPAGDWTLAANPKGLGRITKEVYVTPKDKTYLEIEVGDFGMINIAKIPDRVTLEEVLIGGTPVPSLKFPSAPGNLTIALKNVFYDYTDTIMVQAGETTEVFIKDTPKFGGARFDVSPTVDSHTIEVTPGEITQLDFSDSSRPILDSEFIGLPGNYTAKITAKGRGETVVAFKIKVGEYSQVSVSLNPLDEIAQCNSDSTDCGGRCVNLNTNPFHRGACFTIQEQYTKNAVLSKPIHESALAIAIEEFEPTSIYRVYYEWGQNQESIIMRAVNMSGYRGIGEPSFPSTVITAEYEQRLLKHVPEEILVRCGLGLVQVKIIALGEEGKKIVVPDINMRFEEGPQTSDDRINFLSWLRNRIRRHGGLIVDQEFLISSIPPLEFINEWNMKCSQFPDRVPASKDIG